MPAHGIQSNNSPIHEQPKNCKLVKVLKHFTIVHLFAYK